MSDLDTVLAGNAGTTDNTAATEAAPTDGDATEADDGGTIARQRSRLDKIEGLAGNVREFASKVADTPSQAWGAELREALDVLDGAVAEAVEALAKAPADYKHPRKGGKSTIGAGDKVQIAESFRDEYKFLTKRVQFGVTAVAHVDEVDDKGRATCDFGSGIVTLIPTRRLVHAGNTTPAAAPASGAAS